MRGVEKIMADVLSKIKQACNTLRNRYFRLLILSGLSAEKNIFAEQCAEYVGCKKIKLGTMLSQELLAVPSKQRSSKVGEFFSDFMDEVSPIYFTDIEILFDRNLKIDPLSLLKFVSRNRIVIVNWPGEYSPDNSTIIYANSESLEYYDTQLDKDIICIDEMGQASMDFEYNGGCL